MDRSVFSIAEDAILTMALHEPSADSKQDKRVRVLGNAINNCLWAERHHLAELIEDFPTMEAIPECTPVSQVCDSISQMVRDRNHSPQVPYYPASTRPDTAVMVETYVPHAIFFVTHDHIIDDIVFDDPKDLICPVAEQLGRDWRTLAGPPLEQMHALELVMNEVRDNPGKGPRYAHFDFEKDGARAVFRIKVRANARNTRIVLGFQLKVLQNAVFKEQPLPILAVAV